MDLPNLSRLSLGALMARAPTRRKSRVRCKPPHRKAAPVGVTADELVPGGCGYDPTQGGGGLQQYFADMVLDSNRNAMYAVGIIAGVQAFIKKEGRPPVVLDAGCGTGPLTLFALVAGAERVISVDVDKYHTDRILTRLGPKFKDKCKPMYIGEANPFVDPTPRDELKFDMLVSEVLGTFANSECESYYLPQYAQHMNVHASGEVYCVPHMVRQTFRKVRLPGAVSREIDTNFVNAYMPTEYVGWLYENTTPQYLAAPLLVREDNFSVYPFQVQLPRIELQAGYYAAEWQVELWPGVAPLLNTWEWAHTYALDAHSKHARSREWGLMLFYVNETSTVNYEDTLDAAFVNSPFPDMESEDKDRYEINTGGRDEDERYDTLRYANPFFKGARVDNASVETELNAKLQSTVGAGGVYQGDDLLDVYISMEAVRSGMPPEVPLDALYRVTLGALVDGYREMRATGQWLQTLEWMGVLPFIVSPQQTTPFDVPVKLIPPRGAATDPRRRYRYLTAGAGFFLQ